MEWTGYDRVFGMEDPMKSSKMTWRRQSFQWIVLDATGPRSCDWLRKEKKPFDDLWLHGVMPCKVPCRMCDRMCRASPIDLGFTIRYNSIHIFHIFNHFPFLLHFCFQNVPKKETGEDLGHHTHIQLLTLPQSLNLSIFRLVASRSFVWLGSSADPSSTNRESSDDLYRFTTFVVFKLFGTCGKWHPRCGPVRLAPDPDAERAALLAAVQDCFHPFSCYLCAQKQNLQIFTRNNSNKISTFNHYPEKSNTKIYFCRNIHS